ncbi:hypothetical protein LJR232_005030 [Aquipseudomonas alcaligenes]
MSDVKRYNAGNLTSGEVVMAADYDALLAENEELRVEAAGLIGDMAQIEVMRDQLRAELDAIRGQSHVVAHRMINELGVAVTLWQDGPPPSRIISDRGVEQVDVTAELAYALPPQQPDAVSVPRDLLQRLLDSNNRSTFCAGTYLKAHEELSALLSSRQPEVTE